MPDATEPAPASAFVTPPAYFADALIDSELLLKYAAESGIAVDDVTLNAVLAARSVSESVWNEDIAAALMAALTRLAVLARPVTAASLRASSDAIRPTVRSYLNMAICLAVLIVPFSVASFLVSSISATLRADIAIANDLAVKLDTQTRAPQATTAAAPAPSIPASSVSASHAGAAIAATLPSTIASVPVINTFPCARIQKARIRPLLGPAGQRPHHPAAAHRQPDRRGRRAPAVRQHHPLH